MAVKFKRKIKANLIESYRAFDIQIDCRLMSEIIIEIAENYPIQRLFYVIYCIFVMIRRKIVMKLCAVPVERELGMVVEYAFRPFEQLGMAEKVKLKEKCKITEFFAGKNMFSIFNLKFSVFFIRIKAKLYKKLLE